MDLKPPSQSRAVIVGLEKYEVHTLRGPAVEALEVARTLRDMGMDPARIDLWLAPADAKSRQRADDSGFAWREFKDDDFINFLRDDLAGDPVGGTLYLHWCGHGLAKDDQHYLLLPSSVSYELRSLELRMLSEHLVDMRHASFRHLVFVIDTCRESLLNWGQVFMVPRDLGVNGRANGPVYCTLFVCAEGQTTTYSDRGSANGPALREMLSQAPHGQWPDFVNALSAAGSRVELAKVGLASPYVYATDWFGRPLNWPREPSLDAVFLSAPVEFGRLAELAYLSLRLESPRRACHDVSELVAFLADLPTTLNITPLHEFALRILAECADTEAQVLRDWVAAKVSASEKAGIEKRLKAPAPPTVLMLWVDDFPDAPAGEPAWTVMAALCDANGEPMHLPDRPDLHEVSIATGKPQLLQVLHARMMALLYGCSWRAGPGGIDAAMPALVELFVPPSLLVAGIEREVLDFEQEVLDLSDAYPTLLRNGRQLRTKQNLWLSRAQELLDRWAYAKPLTQALPDRAPQPALAFLQPDGPVWCLVPDASAAPPQLLLSHRVCMDAGLPALAWACGASVPVPDDLQIRLDEGLRGPAAEVSDRLVQLRRAGLTNLTLMFDDPARPPAWTARTGQAQA
jgi:hypothetical protein